MLLHDADVRTSSRCLSTTSPTVQPPCETPISMKALRARTHLLVNVTAPLSAARARCSRAVLRDPATHTTMRIRARRHGHPLHQVLCSGVRGGPAPDPDQLLEHAALVLGPVAHVAHKAARPDAGGYGLCVLASNCTGGSRSGSCLTLRTHRFAQRHTSQQKSAFFEGGAEADQLDQTIR